MLNITFLSLSVSSLFSISPLYTINRNSQRKISVISNSRFQRSISNIIYANTEFHSTTIHKNVFMLTLNTPLVFLNGEQDFCINKKCCLNKNYDFKVNETISGQNTTANDFNTDFKDKNSYFEENCGDLKITNCQFLSCYSTKSCGGGIRVEQYCEVILHNCIFDNCHSNKNGRAAAIAKEIKLKNEIVGNVLVNDDPIHTKTERLDIQYTCFQGCYTDGAINKIQKELSKVNKKIEEEETTRENDISKIQGKLEEESRRKNDISKVQNNLEKEKSFPLIIK